MPKIIHPVEDEETKKSSTEYDVIASFSPDEATEQHETDLFMAENFDDNSSTYWQQEQRKREERHAILCKELDEAIDPKLLKTRKMFEGSDKKAPYAEWHTVVRRLNEFFGHDGWTTKILDVTPLAEDDGIPRIVTVSMQLTVRWPNGGTSTFADIGTGVTRKYGGKYTAAGYSVAVKGAVNDAKKRCATALGEAFCLGLYDDEYDISDIEEDVTESRSSETEKAPTPIRRGPAPSYPVATDDAVAYCESCDKEIKGYTAKTGRSYTTQQLVDYSKRDADGHILCYSCKQDYMNTHKAK